IGSGRERYGTRHFAVEILSTTELCRYIGIASFEMSIHGRAAGSAWGARSAKEACDEAGVITGRGTLPCTESDQPNRTLGCQGRPRNLRGQVAGAQGPC